MSNSDLQSLVRDIVGQQCEGAQNPNGSVLSLDFGTLGRRANDDPSATPHGWRHLTVLSPWRLESEAEIVIDWNTDGGTGGAIMPAIEGLIGQRVVAASTAPPGWDLRIRWSNGLTLVVFGDSTDDREDAWFILGTDGAEAGAVPVLRDVSKRGTPS